MSYDPNALPEVLTRRRRFNLVFLKFVAWGWLILIAFELVHSARVALRCPAAIRTWPNYGLFFAPIVAALPFFYLRWVRRWYRRHPPIAWFSVPWWRRNARRGLVIALLFIVPALVFEIYSYRVGGYLAARPITSCRPIPPFKDFDRTANGAKVSKVRKMDCELITIFGLA
jgi:hypothetical protein